MKQLWPDALPTDMLQIEHEGNSYTFDMTFLMSNWKCLYGQGCVGLHDVDAKTYTTDTGCCRLGSWITEPDDLKNVMVRQQELTNEDWDVELRIEANKRGESLGWMVQIGANKYDENGVCTEVNVKTRVHKGVCIFANRVGGSSGKVGCAFHALANRLGVHHSVTKPTICWQLPLQVVHDEDGDVFVGAWDRLAWGGVNEEGVQPTINWWCIDSPDAYIGEDRVYIYLADELRKSVGDVVYEKLLVEIDKRKGNYVAPMAGTLVNNGQPLLPLVVQDKQCLR